MYTLNLIGQVRTLAISTRRAAAVDFHGWSHINIVTQK